VTAPAALTLARDLATAAEAAASRGDHAEAHRLHMARLDALQTAADAILAEVSP